MIKRTLVLGACLAGLLVSAAPPAVLAANATSAEKIDEVLQLLHAYHLDNVSEDDLARAAIEGMVQSLGDPYTQYFSKEDAAGFFDSLDGISYTVGLEFMYDNGEIVIANVVPGSSADQKGLRAGDALRKINGTRVTLDNVVQLLVNGRGTKEGDSIEFTISRTGAEKTFRVEYKKVELPLVVPHLFAGQTGYIQLATFSDRSEQQFADALKDLQGRGIRSLVLDLRDNGGGSVEDAHKIAALFLKDGVFIYTKDKNGSEQADIIENGTPAGFPVYILVNGGTASASEMLAGALQDRGTAKVIGTTTFGKGVMQSVIPLDIDGGYLKVTTEEYFTPLKHAVNHIGIKPDVEADGVWEPLIKALRLASFAPTQLAIGAGALSLNGVEYPSDLTVIHEGGRTFVPSRIAAALVDADIEWLGGVQAVEFSRTGSSVLYGIGNDGIRLVDGTSYVDLAKLQKQFPSLTGTMAGGRLVLTSR